MRITPKQYAEGLYESIQNAEPSEQTGILDRFFALLVRERRMREIPMILAALQCIIEREGGEKRVRIRSAQALSQETIRSLAGRLSEIFGVEQVVLEQKTDANLKGGMVIETEEETLDMSIKGIVSQLKMALRNSR